MMQLTLIQRTMQLCAESALSMCAAVSMARKPTFHKRNVDTETQEQVDRPMQRNIRIAALAPSRPRGPLRSPAVLLTLTTVHSVPQRPPSASCDSSCLLRLQTYTTRLSSSSWWMSGTGLRKARSRDPACYAGTARCLEGAELLPEACQNALCGPLLFV